MVANLDKTFSGLNGPPDTGGGFAASTGFSPSAHMSTSLQEAVRMVSPIHVRPNTESPIAGYRAPGTKDAKGQNTEWWQSPQGRISTRIFSRGVAGSFAYAIASIAAERALSKYDPDFAIADARYGALGEAGNGLMDRFIRGIARSFDLTLGKAIRGSVKLLTGSEARAEAAVTFRETRNFGRLAADGTQKMGRSFGHEVVDVAFNFAAASIGDAMGRNFAQMIDPHKELSWYKDGKFNLKQFALAQGKAAWKILSYNQGEDWAATPIYVYMMKAQRSAFENTQWGRGFKYVFDHGNADAFKVDEHGNRTGQTYYMQNFMDYQLRFTHYNVLTLMYREVYNSIGDHFNHWVKTGDLPKSEKAKTAGEAVNNFFGGIHDAAVYVGRSFIKGYLLMTFTVPFFSLIRIPQAKHRAIAVHPEMGPMMLSGSMTGAAPKALTPKFREDMSKESQITDGVHIYDYDTRKMLVNDIDGKKVLKANPQLNSFVKKGDVELHFQNDARQNPALKNPFAIELKDLSKNSIERFDPFKLNPNAGVFEKASNAVGKVSYDLSRAAYGLIEEWGYGLRMRSEEVEKQLANPTDKTSSTLIKNARDSDRRMKEATLYHINSAIAYTPYFAAKTEFAELWDKRETDQAMDRLVTGALHLNGREFIGGIGDTWDAFLHPGKTAGLGSVYGVDVNSTSSGWMPWSKKVERGDVVREAAERQAVAAGMFVPTATKEIAAQALATQSPESQPSELTSGFAAKLGARPERPRAPERPRVNELKTASASHVERVEKSQSAVAVPLVRH